MVKVKARSNGSEKISENKTQETLNTPTPPPLSSQGGLGLISNYSGTSSEEDS